MRPKVEAADEARDEHQEHDEEREEELADHLPQPGLGGRRLTVERDGGKRPGRDLPVPVAVHLGAAADSSLERRPHREKARTPVAASASIRIADPPEGSVKT